MSAAASDAGAAGLNFLARALMGREMDKREEKKRIAYEAALEQRQIDAEARGLKRQQETPVERKVYQGSAEQGPPQLLVDQLNSMGESVGQQEASPREKEEFANTSRSQAAALQAERDKMRIDAEDREFNRKDKETRTGIAARNASASERRAAAAETKAGASKAPILSKSEPPISTKDALSSIAKYREGLEDGETWQDRARADGVDPTGLLRAANQGSFSAGPSSRGRPVLGKPKETKQESKDEPPEPGAKKAPDGFWYVQENGKWIRLE